METETSIKQISPCGDGGGDDKYGDTVTREWRGEGSGDGNRCGGLEVEGDEGSSPESDLRFEGKLKRFDGQITRRWLVLLWRRKRGRWF
ncbi:hypothetical protein L1987_33754 [Smallanthus sonchifolius]|uniref:Uncharacterized protein n=1 Tax=Smallanthus sonchifolius TaxID=185202 RepID=A0ACB9HUI5_9ASTR|nr:hypothetical protein L1987_33754 [Smallanthus sonchifolius]